MNDEHLQKMVEEISLTWFSRPFRHRARFNLRLRTSGGRYLLHSHDIECNPKHLEMYGEDELIRIIKHELCHYHLHLEGRGYRHRDRDFQQLLDRVGGSRFCRPVLKQQKRPFKYQLICTNCATVYRRKKWMDPKKYRCGKCRGVLRIEDISS